MPKINTKFVLTVLIILCCTVLALTDKISGEDFQAVVTLAVAIYSGAGLIQKIRDKDGNGKDG